MNLEIMASSLVAAAIVLSLLGASLLILGRSELRNYSIDVGLLALLLAFVIFQIPLLWNSDWRPAGLLAILGAGVVSCGILAWRAYIQSDGRPALELYWGGFGGGLQGMHVRPQFFLGVLTLVGAGFWLSAAHAALIGPYAKPEKPSVESKDKKSGDPEVAKSVKVEFQNLTVNPIELKPSQKDRVKIEPLRVKPFALPDIKVEAVKVEPLKVRPVEVKELQVRPVTVNSIDVNPIDIDVNRIEVAPVRVQAVDVNPLSIKVDPVEVKPIAVCPPGTIPTWLQDAQNSKRK